MTHNTYFQRSLLLLATVALAGMMNPAGADGSGYDTSKKGKVFPIKNGGSGNPQAPSRVYIEYTYMPGRMTFVLPSSIYSTTVELTNDWNAWSGFVTRDQPVLEISYLEGDYTIKCNADDGKTYVGILEF